MWVIDSSHVQMDGLFRRPDPRRRPAVPPGPLDHRPEPSLPHGRNDDQRRRLRDRLVWRGRRACGLQEHRPGLERHEPAGDRGPDHGRRLLFTHIRASTGTPVQRSNCHPFRHGQWLWMHNGAIRGFHEIKRDLLMAVDPVLYPDIEGSTDSEALFFLALTFGLTDDPFTAVARAVGLVEKVGRRARCRIPDPDDCGDHRRRIRLGLPLLQRRTEPVAVLLHRCRGATSAAPRRRYIARSGR